MKTAVIIYHKNIASIYKHHWVDACIASLETQTHKDFDVFEVCYGDYPLSIAAHLSRTLGFRKVFYYHKPMENHVHAMNFILDRVFENGYDVAANTNLDDKYHVERLSCELKEVGLGAELVSSDFVYIKENDLGYEKITHIHKMAQLDPLVELFNDHNILAHPVIMMTQDFWHKYGPYDPTKIPIEDLLLWKKAIDKGVALKIIPKILLYYRLHDKQITADGRK